MIDFLVLVFFSFGSKLNFDPDFYFHRPNLSDLGSGCGTVGRAVASNTRDPQFKSQHGQKCVSPLSNIEKTKLKIKRLR